MAQSIISVKIIGANKVAKNIGNIAKRVKKSQNIIARELAMDLQKGIRFRIQNRLNKRTDRLYNSVQAKQTKHGVWTTTIGEGIPYAGIQEFGGTISGYHFVPAEGKGIHGEGYSKSGGSITIRGQHFVRDSVNSTKRRAGKIAMRALGKAIK